MSCRFFLLFKRTRVGVNGSWQPAGLSVDVRGNKDIQDNNLWRPFLQGRENWKEETKRGERENMTMHFCSFRFLFLLFLLLLFVVQCFLFLVKATMFSCGNYGMGHDYCCQKSMPQGLLPFFCVWSILQCVYAVTTNVPDCGRPYEIWFSATIAAGLVTGVVYNLT